MPNIGMALPLTDSAKGAFLSLPCCLFVKWRAAAVSRRTQGLARSAAVAAGVDAAECKIRFVVSC